MQICNHIIIEFAIIGRPGGIAHKWHIIGIKRLQFQPSRHIWKRLSWIAPRCRTTGRNKVVALGKGQSAKLMIDELWHRNPPILRTIIHRAYRIWGPGLPRLGFPLFDLLRPRLFDPPGSKCICHWIGQFVLFAYSPHKIGDFLLFHVRNVGIDRLGPDGMPYFAHILSFNIKNPGEFCRQLRPEIS